MKKFYVIIFVVISCFFMGCSQKSISDIEINNGMTEGLNKGKTGNPYTVEPHTLSSMEEGAVEHKGHQYKLNDLIIFDEFEVQINAVKYGKSFELVDYEAAQYFNSGFGLLETYNSNTQSLVFINAMVRNTSNKEIECPIGMAQIGNLYDNNRLYFVCECAAIYPTVFAGSQHCLLDKLASGEEKNYILVFRVRDKYQYGNEQEPLVSCTLENAYIALSLTKSTQQSNAPIVKLNIIDNVLKE